jgi:DNA-binding beta-propeller fold protein YncE
MRTRTPLVPALAFVAALVTIGAAAHPGGGALLPSGRRATPAGDQVRVGGFPQVVALSPDGARLAVGDAGAGPESLSLIDTGTWLATHAIPVDNKDTPPADEFAAFSIFDGMTFTPDGARLWVSAGSQQGLVGFDVAPAGLVQNPDARIPVAGSFVGPMALAPDGHTLFAVDASRKSERLLRVDLDTRAVVSAPLGGHRPFGVAVTAEGVYVGGMLSGDVLAFDHALSPVAQVHAGVRPMALAAAGDDVLVADANGDELVVLDAATLGVKQRVDLSIVPGGPGSSPNAIAVRGDRAAVTLGGANAVAIVERAGGTWTMRGALPTGWTPEAVALSPDGSTTYVANARGEASSLPYAPVHNFGPSAIAGWAGTVSRIPIPLDLGAATQQVMDNNSVPQAADMSFLRPPSEGGVIEHVVFILRENKTFDSLLGDTPGGNPAFVMFPRANTPSLHAMADRFATLTAMYANGEASDEGHQWAAGGYVTDFVDRFWAAHLPDSGYTRIWSGSSGGDPILYPPNGYIFDSLEAAEARGLTWRDYGEFLPRLVRGGAPKPGMEDNKHPTYPGWDQSISDTRREAIWEEDFRANGLPNFSFIYLPNDHGFAVDDPENPTLQQQVADNDLATGRIVDAISHSAYWPSTAIFVTEDDPQSAMDHVESHRTMGMVISPWTTRGPVDVHTDTSGMIRTMELLLGLPALSSFDAGARAFPEAFTSAPDFTPFVAPPLGFGIPPGPRALARARAMAMTGDHSGPDRIPDELQRDYAYLSVFGITAEEFAERVGARLPAEDDDD